MSDIIKQALNDFTISGYDTAEALETIVPSADIPYDIEIIAENLNIPWAIDISSEGKLYFTERTGTVRVIENGVLLKQPLITFDNPFAAEGEGGLLGLVLDPKFSENRYIYVMHSYRQNNRLFNRIVRLVEQNNRATIDRIILDRIPGGSIHNGGRLKIGPDKKLYITTGDSGNSALAQNLSSLGGKILRIELDGTIPPDNPFGNSPVYSYGHRDPQGLSWNTNGIFYESEHGQIGHDEINIINSGANYGWPIAEGYEEPQNIKIQKPVVQSEENTWAPSGIAYISQGPWQGKLLVAALRGMQLLVISFDEEGTRVTEMNSMLWNEYGRLREVIQAKDGSVYLATSNRDGRGNAVPTDDRIIRLVPR